ncbi:MAG: exodeoxyribonuclease III [Flavobacteriales bacterium]|nr:exodeoxyribonuclease III [Flavobacteriales bacterium]
MKIISYNVNGIRSAINKGLLDWLSNVNPDIFCVQETKATSEQIDPLSFEAIGYHGIWHSAQKKGYSGVATFYKSIPNHSELGMGKPVYDMEGRVLRTDFGHISLLNCYFPSGTTGEERQDFKYRFLSDFANYIIDLQKSRPNLVICGDLNIAHREIDIHNPVSNKNSSGFLPEERAWLSSFLALGFVDTFREFNPAPHRYSWWTYRAGARKRNLGWRIDYLLASKNLMPNIKEADILDSVVHSDHCPVLLVLDT